MQVLDQQIELIVTASVGLVWSGQHLAHNAQRQNAPAHSTHYFAITIEETNFPYLVLTFGCSSLELLVEPDFPEIPLQRDQVEPDLKNEPSYETT